MRAAIIRANHAHANAILCLTECAAGRFPWDDARAESEDAWRSDIHTVPGLPTPNIVGQARAAIRDAEVEHLIAIHAQRIVDLASRPEPVDGGAFQGDAFQGDAFQGAGALFAPY